MDYNDRSTCVLFGDGGGAALLEYSRDPAIFGMDAGADGNGGKFLYRTAARTEINGIVDTSRLLRQEGQAVYRWVMENVPAYIYRILGRAGLTLEDIDWFAPHSANLRMIEALCKRLPFPIERTLVSVEGSRLTLLTRAGHNVQVDAAPARAAERAPRLVVGQPYTVIAPRKGSATPLEATSITRAKPGQGAWPPDQ